jgi:hypothetical protein
LLTINLFVFQSGYKTFYAERGDYNLEGSPASWGKVTALRHAMTEFPDCRWMWYLDQDGIITDTAQGLEQRVLSESKLSELMLKDRSVVPPESIIKTFSHIRAEDIDFVVTQDNVGMSIASFAIRNGEWAKFFLDTWFDPLYRSYNFQKAEAHALVGFLRPLSPNMEDYESITPLTRHGTVGTYRPVASDHPLEACPRSTARPQQLRQAQPRRDVPRG